MVPNVIYKNSSCQKNLDEHFACNVQSDICVSTQDRKVGGWIMANRTGLVI